MTGIIVRPTLARAVLVCNKCRQEWRSSPFEFRQYGDEVAAAAPAFDRGWRVYVGARNQNTYCPDHEPSVPMRPLYPRSR